MAAVVECEAAGQGNGAATDVKKTTVAVTLCSDVEGLREAVETSFASSPLAERYELRLSDMQVGAGSPTEAEILLADPGKVAPVLESVRNLRWLQSTWAGVNALASTKRRDYTCSRLAGCFGSQMSEYVFGAIFLDEWHRLQGFQAEVQWVPEAFKKRPRLSTMTLGFLGAGDISSVIAKRAQAFAMRTVGFASREGPREGFDEVSTSLAHVLSTADIVVNLLPSTPATRGLLTGGVLEKCGTGKLFINVGRGDVVSEEALLEALRPGGPLRRAVLDVFSTEPLPSTSPLWTHPSVQISPHISAISFPDDVANLFVENLALWLRGDPPKYVVDLDRGY